MDVFKYGALALAVTALTACGGGGGSSSDDGDSSTPPANQQDTSTGVFTDSAVANIYYETETQSGYTNGLGEYDYVEGETVTFRIGGPEGRITLPPVTATGRVTPADMAIEGGSEDLVTNILRLLQSLDDDGNPDNGITITEETHTALVNAVLEVNEQADAFETQFANEVAGPTSKSLITAEEAEEHFYASQQADLRGSWIFVEPEGESRNGQGPNGEEINVVTFLADGTYILAHKYGNADQGAASAEWGTYTWDPVSGALNTNPIGSSESGEGGLCPTLDPCSDTVQLVGDELHLGSEADATAPFQAVKDSDNPYVGAWFLAEGEDFNVLTILDDTHYVVAHSNNAEGYTGEDLVAVSSEWGTYSLTDGTFEVTGVEEETDGPGGLYDASGAGGMTAATELTNYGDFQFTPTNEDMFSFRKVGRFGVELTDLAGNTSTAIVERYPGGFEPDSAMSFEYELVGENDTAAVTLEFDGSGSVVYGSDGESTQIDTPWVANAGGTLSYSETNPEDSSTGYWVFAPIMNADNAMVTLVEFRHIDGGTESFYGFYISELTPLFD